MLDPKKILKTIDEMQAHASIINSYAIQLRNDLERVYAPAPKGGNKLSDVDKALLKRKLYKRSMRKHNQTNSHGL